VQRHAIDVKPRSTSGRESADPAWARRRGRGRAHRTRLVALAIRERSVCYGGRGAETVRLAVEDVNAPGRPPAEDGSRARRFRTPSRGAGAASGPASGFHTVRRRTRIKEPAPRRADARSATATGTTPACRLTTGAASTSSGRLRGRWRCSISRSHASRRSRPRFRRDGAPGAWRDQLPAAGGVEVESEAPSERGR